MTLLFSSQITHSETRHRLCGASLWDSVDKLCKQSPVFFNVAYAMEDQDPVGASCTSFIHVSQLHLFLPPHLQSVHHTNDSAKDSSELKVLTLPYNYSGVEIFVSMLRYFFFLVYGSTCIVSVYSRATICAHFNLYYHFILMSPASQRFIAHFPVPLEASSLLIYQQICITPGHPEKTHALCSKLKSRQDQHGAFPTPSKKACMSSEPICNACPGFGSARSCQPKHVAAKPHLNIFSLVFIMAASLERSQV